MPAPRSVDYDGDGTPSPNDEWTVNAKHNGVMRLTLLLGLRREDSVSDLVPHL
jgi:hypothetical protein